MLNQTVPTATGGLAHLTAASKHLRAHANALFGVGPPAERLAERSVLRGRHLRPLDSQLQGSDQLSLLCCSLPLRLVTEATCHITGAHSRGTLITSTDALTIALLAGRLC